MKTEVIKNTLKLASIFERILWLFYLFIKILLNPRIFLFIASYTDKSKIEKKVKLGNPYHITNSTIGKYSYIAPNSNISETTIGKFCSIGPNLLCGWGIHTINGLSTAPMFYSTQKQNGFSLSKIDKIQERKTILIGNDVFIGANVTILDGVSIGDGAVIGAGAVVSKNIPPYAVAVGVPIKIIKYRFNNEHISKLLKIKWWDFEDENLINVEKLFFEIDKFIEKYE